MRKEKKVRKICYFLLTNPPKYYKIYLALGERPSRRATYGPVAQLGERTVRIREVRGFDPLRVHQKERSVSHKVIQTFLYHYANKMPSRNQRTSISNHHCAGLPPVRRV